MVDPIDLGISSGAAVDVLCNAWHSDPLCARRLALRIAPAFRHFLNGFSVCGLSHLRFCRVLRHLRTSGR